MNSDERMLDLVAYLLAARRRVTADEIYSSLDDQYKGSADARERKFSRDKEALRELGVPLNHFLDDEGTSVYELDRNAFFLPDIALTPDERAALFAVGAEAVKATFPLRRELAYALTKLRATGPDGQERTEPLVFAAGVRGSEVEETIVRAVTERLRLRFLYSRNAANRTGGEDDEEFRVVDPYAFSSRRNRFAIVGFCHVRQGVRTFFADRMIGCGIVHPEKKSPEFEIPADFDPAPHLPRYPWQVRVHAPVRVELEFTPELAESGPKALGIESGSVCETTNLDGLVSQVISLGAGVRIVGPEKARTRVREQLRGLAQTLGAAK